MRELAITLLNDDHGINVNAWHILRDLLIEEGHEDIVDAVKATEGRFYLTETAVEKIS